MCCGIGIDARVSCEWIDVVRWFSDSDAAATKASRVDIDKNRQTVKLFDKSGSLIGLYPATAGSEEKPSSTGTLKVTAISRNPTYRYNPAYHFKGVHARKSFTIKPGSPVSIVWINLSADGCGIHGTPSPEKVQRVAARVAKGTPV